MNNCYTENGVLIPPIVQIADSRKPERAEGVLNRIVSPVGMSERERKAAEVREYWERNAK